MTIIPGIDHLIQQAYAPLRGKRVGLFTNLNATTRDLVPTVDALRAADAVTLAALFSPEHGLAGTAADGAPVAHHTGPDGLPVYSLYGETYRPTAAMLDGLDVLVCDIQDIGVRYYTFLWTVTHIIEACGAHGVPVLILDRPNPLGGRIDGGGLDPALASLVGRFDVPVQHGMTLGEVARLVNAAWNPTPAEIDVIPCRGWARAMPWDETGLPFVPPSPNMPHFVTALHYPGACLVEGTILSEGRGTPLPFELVGAPFINGAALARRLNALTMPGARFRAYTFTPSASKFAGQSCGGVQVHITDRAAYRPLAVWLGVLREIRQLYPDDFAWLPPYWQSGLQHFDRLIGAEEVRAMLDAGAAVDDITAGWAAYTARFAQMRAPYLLYE